MDSLKKSFQRGFSARVRGDHLFILLVQLLWILGCVGGSTATPNPCPASNDEPVQQFDVTIPTLPVPDDVITTYICQGFKVPVSMDTDYHAVAFQPLIDNRDVMHHMILFACDGHDVSEGFTEPHSCGRGDNQCRSWIVQWSMGVDGVICPYNQTGVRFGRSKGSYFLLQIHWNNENLRKNMTDHSGMRVFYTPDLRPYDLGHVQVGQQELLIPPGVVGHAQSGGCSGECTKMLLPQPIYLTTIHLHMHYLGSGGSVDVMHENGDVTEVIYDDSFDFTRPAVHHIISPIPVHPGDYLRVRCLFNSRDGPQRRNTTVYFGEGSDGEMCYAFIAYFPQVTGLDQCLQLGTHDLNCNSPSRGEFEECAGGYLHQMKQHFIPDTLYACNKTERLLCSDGCRQALEGLNSHPCMQGQLGGYVQRQLLPSIPDWGTVQQASERFNSLCGALSLM